jgi:hypothetical protein
MVMVVLEISLAEADDSVSMLQGAFPEFIESDCALVQAVLCADQQNDKQQRGCSNTHL